MFKLKVKKSHFNTNSTMVLQFGKVAKMDKATAFAMLPNNEITEILKSAFNLVEEIQKNEVFKGKGKLEKQIQITKMLDDLDLPVFVKMIAKNMVWQGLNTYKLDYIQNTNLVFVMNDNKTECAVMISKSIALPNGEKMDTEQPVLITKLDFSTHDYKDITELELKNATIKDKDGKALEKLMKLFEIVNNTDIDLVSNNIKTMCSKLDTYVTEQIQDIITNMENTFACADILNK